MACSGAMLETPDPRSETRAFCQQIVTDVALARGSMVSLLINQGDGSFSAMSPIASITAIDGLALGNVDVGAGSRSTDLVVSSSVSQKVALLLNQATY